jgi:hypothetical protein
MAMMVLDPAEERRLKQQRALTGADRFDEVWEGVYMMAPLANNEHQQFSLQLAAICLAVVPWPDERRVYAGVNVGDREMGWKRNYRCPDVAVFLRGTRARGGPAPPLVTGSRPNDPAGINGKSSRPDGKKRLAGLRRMDQP